jgi:hypothetical protein
MTLPIPTVALQLGPDWANNVNAALGILDQHSHTSGQGVQIPAAGINLQSALSFNGNQATNLQAAVFTPQSAVTANDSLYVLGVDLYYRDGTGAQIPITHLGAVTGATGTITGLPSSPAGASANYASGTFTFNSAVNTPANIQAGSYILTLPATNPTPNTLILAPPAGLATTSYTITLPVRPSGNPAFLTMDTVGNIASTVSTLNGITRTNQAAVGQQVSASSSGGFTTTLTSPVNSGLSVTITTTGRPVVLQLINDGSGNASIFGSEGSTGASAVGAVATIVRTGTSTPISSQEVYFQYTPASGTSKYIFVPTSSINHLDVITAGTYIYTVYVASLGGTALLQYSYLVAYEL